MDNPKIRLVRLSETPLLFRNTDYSIKSQNRTKGSILSNKKIAIFTLSLIKVFVCCCHRFASAFHLIILDGTYCFTRLQYLEFKIFKSISQKKMSMIQWLCALNCICGKELFTRLWHQLEFVSTETGYRQTCHIRIYSMSV